MAKIYQIPTAIPGTVGVFPNQKFCLFGDDLSTVTAAGYLNQANLQSIPLSQSDIICAFYNYNLNTKSGNYGEFTVAIDGSGSITLTQVGQAGTGTVNNGLANQLAYYSSNGTAVGGLATANSSVLVTNSSGVPSLSTTLPTNLAMQTPASIVLTNGSGLPVAGIDVGANSAMIVTSSSGVPSATASMTDLQVVGGVTGGTPKPFTLVAGSNVTIVQDTNAGTITVNATGGGGGTGFAWIDVAGTTQAMSVNTGYVATNSAQVVFTLPTTSAVGDRIAVQDSGLGGWRINQGANQIIRSNAATTTLGATGYLQSGQPFDVVYLLCIVADTEWAYNGGFGNYTYM